MPLRNSLHRKNHKERSQLANRARFGILEKHKDYVLRARDYHSKQDRINRLRQKAEDKNKDEFYFGMVKQKTKAGVHIQSRGNAPLPVDFVKVLKSQDEDYIRTVRMAGLKKIDKLKERLSVLVNLAQPGEIDEEVSDSGLDEEEIDVLRNAGLFSKAQKGRETGEHGLRRKHIMFVSDDAEANAHRSRKRLAEGSPAATPGTPLVFDLGWKSSNLQNSIRSPALHFEKGALPLPNTASREEVTKAKKQLLKELSARLVRDTQLRYAERELEMQKLLMSKGAKKKLMDVQRVGGDDEEDENELDAMVTRRKKHQGSLPPQSDKLYKPRVYKWRAERKR